METESTLTAESDSLETESEQETGTIFDFTPNIYELNLEVMFNT